MKKNETKTNPATIFDGFSAIIADPKSTDSEVLIARYELAKLSNPDKTPADILAELNEDSKRTAIKSIVKAENGATIIDWYAFLLGVTYPVLTGEDSNPTATKELRVSDFIALKTSKRSRKFAIDGTLYGLLDMFGGNICTEYHKTRETTTATDLLFLSKYTSDLDGFKAENPQSVNAMEKQMQTIWNTLFTAERAPKAKKMYVRHLSDRYNKATKDGYANANAIGLLQEVVNHARDAKAGKKYEIKGRLECQKKNDQ